MTKGNSNTARRLAGCCLVGDICHMMLVMLSLVALMCVVPAQSRPAEQEEWLNAGRQELRRAMKVSKRQNTNLARNIILFVGDGMGISTVTASRIRGGQLRGEDGEENLLFFERFPHVGLVKTYSADSQVTGSAAAGSAILTGVKINSGVLGCDSRVKKGNCTAFTPDTKLRTILHAFIDEGLSTGIVTNSRITHATPASAYAQTPHRAWEGDVDLPDDEDCAHVDDIAKQLILNNADIKVILGGGRRYFLDNCTQDPVLGTIDPHQRRDGLNLVDEWVRDKINRNASYRYVWEKADFDTVDSNTTDFLLGPNNLVLSLHDQTICSCLHVTRNILQECSVNWGPMKKYKHTEVTFYNTLYGINGDIDVNNRNQHLAILGIPIPALFLSANFAPCLFNPSHMDFDLHDSNQGVNRTEPTLVEMTQKAIEVLSKDPKGYFLMVEGARIDFGHHANSAITAITETLDLDEAVHTAVRMTGSHETLIVVTADHSHAFAIQGYAPRGHDILGTADPGLDIGPLDGLPYTTLGYTNGPVFGREDLTHVDTGSAGFRQSGCIPVSIETHAGEDVSVYALGPMAHFFHATHEQNYLYHVMEYAACVGDSKVYCRNSKAHSRRHKTKTSKRPN